MNLCSLRTKVDVTKTAATDLAANTVFIADTEVLPKLAVAVVIVMV